MSHTTVLCLLTNIGNDLHMFPSAKSFSSWLRLAPDNKTSGGQIIKNKTPVEKNYCKCVTPGSQLHR
ncbi:transposase [Limnovirga soli]|uniref:transposase n=1 Tax=Limnovirga soli TaxID=2656915 RepID=UPI003743B678